MSFEAFADFHVRPQDIEIRQLTTLKEVLLLEDVWRGLEDEVGDGLLPFQTFAWNLAWWNVFARQKFGRRDVLRVLAFFDANRLVAVLPLFETHFGLKKFLTLRYLRPFGADRNLSEIRTPLALPEYVPLVLDSVLGFLAKQENAPTMVQLIGPAAEVEAVSAQHGHLKVIRSRQITNYVLPLRGDWALFRSRLKRNIKESLRHCYNSLARLDWQHELVVFDQVEDIKNNLPEFYRLHSLRAATVQSSVTHPDYFESPLHRRFIEAAIEGLGFGGKRCPHLFCLRVNGRFVAMRMGFYCGSDMYLYYSGYDPDYARFSVMTTLLAETFKWCIANGVVNANLSIGTDVSKTRWGPFSVTYQDSRFARASRRGRLMEWAVNTRKRYSN